MSDIICTAVTIANVFVLLGLIISIIFMSTLILIPFAVIIIGITLLIAFIAGIVGIVFKCWYNVAFSAILFIVLIGLIIDSEIKRRREESNEQ